MTIRIIFAAIGVASVTFLIYLSLAGVREPAPDPASLDKASGQPHAIPVGSAAAVVVPPDAPPAQQGIPGADSVQQATDLENAAIPKEESPRTGQQAPPLEPEIRRALGRILNTSSQGLVEKTHEGVVSVDLQHRFQTAPVATVNPQGDVQITDYSQLPPEPAEPPPP